MSDELILMIDNTAHRGWTELTISRAIERVYHEFDVRLSDRWGDSMDSNPRTIVAGLPVQALINDELIFTGYIDDVDPEYDANSHSLTVRGRSKTGDLVDCSTEGRQFKNQSLEAIARELARPFGIGVEVDASAQAAAAQPFSTQSLDLGQPIFEFLEELARIRAVLLTATAAGNLRITRASTGRADSALALGQNIERASGSFSHRELFSDYIVSAQQPGMITLDGIDTSQPKAHVKGHGRYRPLVISNDTSADNGGCQARAEWQRNVHFGRSRGIVYTTTGWRQTPGGRLWQPNERVPVSDIWCGIDTELLLVEVRFRLSDEGGRSSELRVMPPEAFDLKPLPESANSGVELNL